VRGFNITKLKVFEASTTTFERITENSIERRGQAIDDLTKHKSICEL